MLKQAGCMAVEGRKERVLRAVIEDYLITGELVGSRTVARKYHLGVSPATVRNEMADLEDMGYLEQPHTSAGRVPSDLGYRYHVDTLPEQEPEQADGDAATVRRVLAARAQRMAEIIWQATRVLAEMTDFLSLASQPPSREARLCAVQLVPLHGDLVLLLVIADDGRVMNRVAEVEGGLGKAELVRMGQVITEELAGIPLGQVGRVLVRTVAAEMGRYRDLADELLSLLDHKEEPGEEHYVVGGTTNLLKQPEFQEVSKAQSLLAAVERRQVMEEVMSITVPNARVGVDVAIGREIPVPALANCAVITAVFTAPGGVTGRVGVLGPRRMDYLRVMRIVEHVAEGVTALLQGER